jgi:hypothetical protein
MEEIEKLMILEMFIKQAVFSGAISGEKAQFLTFEFACSRCPNARTCRTIALNKAGHDAYIEENQGKVFEYIKEMLFN